MDSHEKYLELCAASTAGELSGEEERTLEEHLAVCASCRQAKHEFEMTVQRAVPALADDLASATAQSDTPWSVEKAEAAFFKRLKADQNSSPPADGALGKLETEPTGRRLYLSTVQDTLGRTLDALCGMRAFGDCIGNRRIPKWWQHIGDKSQEIDCQNRCVRQFP